MILVLDLAALGGGIFSDRCVRSVERWLLILTLLRYRHEHLGKPFSTVLIAIVG